MATRFWLGFCLTTAVLALALGSEPLPACCPAPPSGKPVVNADQTVIIIWDRATQMQHFIRQASFKSEADDFGFLVPSPYQPQLEESGNEAFPYLRKLTEPEVQKRARPSGISCGCGGKSTLAEADPPRVQVLEEKRVAGFHAAVLEAESADALVGWLKENGYAYSPEIEEWAKPYVKAGWKITALKVAKDKDAAENKTVAAAALRISFKSARPLFPYREPDSRKSAEALGARQRLLRIYFIADSRYQGELTKEVPWTGKLAWANQLSADDRKRLLEMLKLPENTGPEKWWLTEFEDPWPYQRAPADVYFAAAADQTPMKRPPIIDYVAAPLPADAMAYVLGATLVLPPLLRRMRKEK